MKYALTYGLLSGFVIIVTMIAGIALSGSGSFFSSEWFGYLVMLVALTFIFVGVKRYRDVERGGVIKFGPRVRDGTRHRRGRRRGLCRGVGGLSGDDRLQVHG